MTEIYTTIQWIEQLVTWMKQENLDTFKHADLPEHLKENAWFRRATASDYLRVVKADTPKIWKVNRKFWY